MCASVDGVAFVATVAAAVFVQASLRWHFFSWFNIARFSHFSWNILVYVFAYFSLVHHFIHIQSKLMYRLELIMNALFLLVTSHHPGMVAYSNYIDDTEPKWWNCNQNKSMSIKDAKQIVPQFIIHLVR